MTPGPGLRSPFRNVRDAMVAQPPTPGAERLAADAARRVAEPEPASPSLVVAAFQSSI